MDEEKFYPTGRYCSNSTIRFFFYACTTTPQRPALDDSITGVSSGLDQTEPILKTISLRNHTLVTYKGIGNIKIWDDRSVLSARIAWIAEAPDRLRLELFGIPGQRSARLASDGQWVYLDPQPGSKLYKHKLSDRLFRHLLPVSLTVRDMIALLAGRVPPMDHQRSQLILTPDGKFYRLTLETHWWGERQEILIDVSTKDIRRIDVFHSGGSLKYRAEFIKMKRIKTYRVPQHLKISNGDGKGVLMDISRYWADVAVTPEQFTLTIPK